MPSVRENQAWCRGRTTGVLFKGLKPIPFDPSIDPPSNACFNCWVQGHTRRTCPKEIIAGDLCHNCGRLDVIMSNCPRCAEAYVTWAQASDKNRFLSHQRATDPAGSLPQTGKLIDLDNSCHLEIDPEQPSQNPSLAPISAQPSLLDEPVRVSQPGTVLVFSNLHPNTSEAQLEDLISTFGPLHSIFLHRDLDGQPTGTAEVVFVQRSHAVQALSFDLRLNDRKLESQMRITEHPSADLYQNLLKPSPAQKRTKSASETESEPSLPPAAKNALLNVSEQLENLALDPQLHQTFVDKLKQLLEDD